MKIKLEKDGIKLNSNKDDMLGIDMADPLNIDVEGHGIESGINPKIIKPSDAVECLSSANQEECREKKLAILCSLFDDFI
ncbi:hypothetical protein [Halocella sp. SP3-1]|uniref:hypothetical protein n=1 Tax=Halocella sp. SP3-1 TaxID=2382161 RepID=UPI000F75C884|nr:hypothetical protein [Halocella sp. SP3-1]AZO95321.1 hypothetical protein D7D81_12345 [Halocella sp. SP3-1]